MRLCSVLLLAALCACDAAYYFEAISQPDLHESESQFQIEDPLLETSEFPLPPHLRRCMPTMCCPIHLTCGPPYECHEGGKMVRNMEPCL